MTREVQASEAKTHLPRLLDAVERGETIIITRHGRRIARIVPDAERRQQEIKEAIDNIKKLGKKIREETGGATIEEIISSIHEGHEYYLPLS
jgi:prevent-host-death family protein